MGNSTAWILRKRRTNSRSSRGRGLAGGREAAGTAVSSAPLRQPFGTPSAPAPLRLTGRRPRRPEFGRRLPPCSLGPSPGAASRVCTNIYDLVNIHELDTQPSSPLPAAPAPQSGAAPSRPTGMAAGSASWRGGMVGLRSGCPPRAARSPCSLVPAPGASSTMQKFMAPQSVAKGAALKQLPLLSSPGFPHRRSSRCYRPCLKAGLTVTEFYSMQAALQSVIAPR